MSFWNRDTPYIIFEAGLNHNGDIGLAKELVHAAADSGSDAVKFQKRDIYSLATKEVLDGEELRFPSLGKTYREVRSRLEFDLDQYAELRELAKNLGLDFMVTPFDLPSLSFLLSVGLDAVKIASHSVANPRLLREISTTGLPIVMSSGMVTLHELDNAVGIFTSQSADIAILHCSSEYPTSDEGANLSLINVLMERYGLPTGFSSHEIGITHTLAAVAMGAKVLERHVTISKDLEGFDHKMSMDVQEFASLVSNVRALHTALGDGIKRVTPTEQLTRDKYRVSMVSSRSLKLGEVLDSAMVVYKNPGTGIPAMDEQKYLGRRLRTDVLEDTLLSPDHFEA